MGTEDWVLKGTKLITNIKRQRLKIYSRGWIFKNTLLKKRRRKKKEKRKKKTRKQQQQQNKATRIIKKHQQQPHKDYIWCLL